MSLCYLRATTRADTAAIDWPLVESYEVLLKPDYPASVLGAAKSLNSRAGSERDLRQLVSGGSGRRCVSGGADDAGAAIKAGFRGVNEG